VLEPTANAPDRPSPVGAEVVYDGVVAVNEATAARPAYSLKPAAKATRLLPAYVYQRGLPQNDGSVLLPPQVVYPAELRELRGWVVLPPGAAGVVDPRDVVAGVLEDVLVDPPSVAGAWFQGKPVLLREWRDLAGNVPSVEEVLRHAPEPRPCPALAAHLAHWGLRLSDVPWALWRSVLLADASQGPVAPYDPAGAAAPETDDEKDSVKATCMAPGPGSRTNSLRNASMCAVSARSSAPMGRTPTSTPPSGRASSHVSEPSGSKMGHSASVATHHMLCSQLRYHAPNHTPRTRTAVVTSKTSTASIMLQ
jgi:hypothetical protein